MKKLLKLYKMFYRLLRLKHWQRVEIENRMFRNFILYPNKVLKECDELQQELIEWHHLARTYMVKTPKELHELISDIQVKTMNEVVKDFETWNDCDVSTEDPGEKYYRVKHDWVLVKTEERLTGYRSDIPYVAEYQRVKRVWLFRDTDPEHPYFDSLKVIKWRPIY